MKSPLTALFLIAISFPSLAAGETGRLPSQTDLDLVSRCSNAARLVAAGATASGGNREVMHSFITDTHRGMLEQNISHTPKTVELVVAQSVFESLMNGANLDNPPERDWLVGNAAATCAVQMRLLGKG